MRYFVDRRENPKGKSMGNRQRFVHRARARIKEVVNKSLKDRSIKDLASGETITIPSKGIEEPKFLKDPRSGKKDRVFPGNKEFVPGDTINRPQQGAGGQGKKASEDGGGEDNFSFTLTRDEFLDLFFEDLELPALVKKSLTDTKNFQTKHAGYRTTGSTSNITLVRTMRQSLARRMALKRPKKDEIEELEAKIAELEAKKRLGPRQQERLEELKAELEKLMRKRQVVGFIDPIDVRYHAFEKVPQPNSKAVMFCLMDVSGSMGEREKELAKRFFLLLHLFLDRKYEYTEIVFIRHTHVASEVDEETFFYGRESGGTVVSRALEEMIKVQKKRYPADIWNIYGAQVSDGDNINGDSEACIKMLNDDILPLLQYYTYIEVVDEREMDIVRNGEGGSALWRSYRQVRDAWSLFKMGKISEPGDIYGVFRDLFAKDINGVS
ncbi:YeaH/YhbH family protein [Terasakiella sp. A23]|uniref:YeaH/YhbH family protein n=1 Tax=Terasakiella sp. FCG-A23 TaxID=3080561 RepID=UPI002955C306|nr:YeaH/YhbH family protein [Terasakiella sp. A23]MDV7338386.1 YeaH/YhbH family protein [Terasakiella sp. A23]